MAKKMSSRIYFEGNVTDSEQVKRYSTEKSYVVGNQCTDLYVDERGQSAYVLLRCISDTSGDWQGQAERNEVNNQWTISEGKHTFDNLKVLVESLFLKKVSLSGQCFEQKKIPLNTKLELLPGTYQFGGMANQSATRYHLEYDDFNSLESTTFTIRQTTKSTLYLVVEPNYVYALMDKNNILSIKIYQYTGDNWKYHWNPSDWEFVKGVKGYNAGKQYKPGNKCIYQFGLYKCLFTTPSSGEPWLPAHWEPIMQDVKQWMDHVNVQFGSTATHTKAMYLYTNACKTYNVKNELIEENGLKIDIEEKGHKVTVYGTPTADTKITVCKNVRCDAKHAYYMDGCPSGESKTKHYLEWGPYKSYEGRCSGGKSGATHDLVLVIKKQTPGQKVTYDYEEFIPELNDTACYDSNCNGLIWKRWSTNMDGVECVDLIPNWAYKYYVYSDGSGRYRYANGFEMFEAFGWGDKYGNIPPLQYDNDMTTGNPPMVIFTGNKSHAIAIGDYYIYGTGSNRAAYVSSDGMNWSGQSIIGTGSWYFRQGVPGPGSSIFTASCTWVMEDTNTYRPTFHIFNVRFKTNSNQVDEIREVLTKTSSRTYSRSAYLTGVETTFLYNGGNDKSKAFFNLPNEGIHAVNQISAYNNGDELKSGIYTYGSTGWNVKIYDNGKYTENPFTPETFPLSYELYNEELANAQPLQRYYSLYKCEFNHINTHVYDGVYYENYMLIFSMETREPITYDSHIIDHYDTVINYWWRNVVFIRHTNGMQSYEYISGVPFNCIGSVLHPESKGTGFSPLWIKAYTSYYFIPPILRGYVHGGSNYIMYGGNREVVHSTYEITNKILSIYEITGGGIYTNIVTYPPDKTWTFSRASNDDKVFPFFPNLSRITLHAWYNDPSEPDSSHIEDVDITNLSAGIFTLHTDRLGNEDSRTWFIKADSVTFAAGFPHDDYVNSFYLMGDITYVSNEMPGYQRVNSYITLRMSSNNLANALDFQVSTNQS